MSQEKDSAIMEMDEFMSCLNIGRTTAYRLLQSGEVKVFKIGRIYKIPRKSVMEYIERKRK